MLGRRNKSWRSRRVIPDLRSYNKIWHHLRPFLSSVPSPTSMHLLIRGLQYSFRHCQRQPLPTTTRRLKAAFILTAVSKCQDDTMRLSFYRTDHFLMRRLLFIRLREGAYAYSRSAKWTGLTQCYRTYFSNLPPRLSLYRNTPHLCSHQ